LHLPTAESHRNVTEIRNQQNSWSRTPLENLHADILAKHTAILKNLLVNHMPKGPNIYKSCHHHTWGVQIFSVVYGT